MRLNLTWGQVAEATAGTLRGRAEAPFAALSTDSRKLGNDQAFWALVGPRFDAHTFLNPDLSAKSAGWVVQQGRDLPKTMPTEVLSVTDTTEALGRLAAYHRNRFDIPVVAITGSNGKTTVKEMLAAIFLQRGPTAATSGNFNNEIGLPLSLLELTEEHHAGVFEMGASHPGDIASLVKLAAPTLGILTNIGPAHLEFFGDLRGVFKTKSELVDGLPANAPVVLNADDEWLVQLLPRIGDRAITFGYGRGAQVRVIESDAKGKITLSFEGQRLVAQLQTHGKTAALNAAAAAAAAHALNYTAEEIQAGLAAFRPASLRGERRTAQNGSTLILDCYNANPGSMRAGVEDFLSNPTNLPRILVLGDMEELGAGSDELHHAMGLWLKDKKIDALLLAGPKMKSAVEALAGANFSVDYSEDPGELTEFLKKHTRKEALVYFKASRKLQLETLAAAL
jgi:UDP-N-acetylmuramoyl-tripeptide--D-alanyl-D-alanine ligase